MAVHWAESKAGPMDPKSADSSAECSAGYSALQRAEWKVARSAGCWEYSTAATKAGSKAGKMEYLTAVLKAAHWAVCSADRTAGYSVVSSAVRKVVRLALLRAAQ